MARPFLILAIAAAAGPAVIGEPASAQSAPSGARGIYVVMDPYNPNFYCDFYNLISHTGSPTFTVAGITGVFLDINWSDVQYDTTHNRYNFAAGSASNTISLTCGGGSTVYADVGTFLADFLPANTKLSFEIKAGDATPSSASSLITQAPIVMVDPIASGTASVSGSQAHGMYFTSIPPNGGTAMCLELPLPWEDGLAAAYTTVINQLALYLYNEGRWPDVRIIKLGGLNEHTGEVHLGSNTQLESPGGSCAGTYGSFGPTYTVTPQNYPEATEWLDFNGYLASKAEAAWAQLEGGQALSITGTGLLSVSRISSAVSSGQLILSVPVINTKSFPKDSITITNTASEQAFMLKLINDLVGGSTPPEPPSVVAVQFNALGVCEPYPSSTDSYTSNAYTDCTDNSGTPNLQLVCEENYETGVNYGTQTLIGWQTNGYGVNDAQGIQQSSCAGERQGGGCPLSEYLDMLDNGIRNGATFVEVWPGDASHYSSLVGTAASQLTSATIMTTTCQYETGEPP